MSTRPLSSSAAQPPAAPPAGTTLVVAERFCGPPGSGNGGWTAGAVAALVLGGGPDHAPDPAGTVEVTLTAPPPLGVAMTTAREDDVLVVRDGEQQVARARAVADAPTPVAATDPARAHAAAAAYPGHRTHPFPGCFVCGPERADGLRIFPGPIPGEPGRWAAPWTPAADLAGDPLPLTWAALDCIGGWAGDLTERTMVLGRMTARAHGVPTPGEEHVLVAEARGQEGRKVRAATSLYDAAGALVASAEQVWIVVDPAPAAR